MFRHTRDPLRSVTGADTETRVSGSGGRADISRLHKLLPLTEPLCGDVPTLKRPGYVGVVIDQYLNHGVTRRWRG